MQHDFKELLDKIYNESDNLVNSFECMCKQIHLTKTCINNLLKNVSALERKISRMEAEKLVKNHCVHQYSQTVQGFIVCTKCNQMILPSGQL